MFAEYRVSVIVRFLFACVSVARNYMKGRNAMKLLFLMLAFGCVCGFCQPNPNQCVFVPISIEDPSCSMNTWCESRNGYPSINFTVPCDSCFCIDLEWLCPTTCAGCEGCAWIYRGTEYITAVHHQNCASNDCHVSSCDQGGFANLKSGSTYTLYACLTNCETMDCSKCETGCKLKATVRYRTIACTN